MRANAKGSVFRRKRPDGSTSETWTGKWTDAAGIIRQRSLGTTNEAEARDRLDKIVRDVALERAGQLVVDPFERYRLVPLRDHLKDYEQSLVVDDDGNGNNPDYVRSVVHRIGAILKGCQLVLISDMQRPGTVGRIKAHLRTVPDPRFRKQKRTIGRSTQAGYLRALRAFANWLERSGRTSTAPIKFQIRKVKDADLRRPRRGLSLEDLRTLLQTTLEEGKTRIGRDWRMTGYDRYVLYLTACATGLRASELAGVRVSALDLESDPPTIKARIIVGNKGKTIETLPINTKVADVLRAYIDERPPTALVWPGRWAETKRGSRFVQADLEAAGMEYQAEDGIFDFHSHRGQYVTSLILAGVPLKVTQKLARHASVVTTMEAYARVEAVRDGAKYVEAMDVPTIDDPPESDVIARCERPGKPPLLLIQSKDHRPVRPRFRR